MKKLLFGAIACFVFCGVVGSMPLYAEDEYYPEQYTPEPTIAPIPKIPKDTPREGAVQYIEAQGGIISNSWGIRGGKVGSFWDTSLGYTKSERHDVDLHTIGTELYFTVPIEKVTTKIGAGIGFTIPHFNGSESGDTGHSWTLGAGAEYPLTSHWAVVGMLKGFFFTTDTKKETYGEVTGRLGNGLPVDVTEVHYEYAPRQFNSLMIGLAIRYYF